MDFFFFNERRTEGEKRTLKREEEHGQKHPGKREKDLEEKYDDEINANDTLFTTSGASSPKCDAYRAGERRISPPEARIREIDKQQKKDLRSISEPKEEHPKNRGNQWETTPPRKDETRYRKKDPTRPSTDQLPPKVPPKEGSIFMKWALNLPHHKSEGVLENVAECEVTTRNIAEAWKILVSDEKLAQVEARLSGLTDMAEITRICAMQWKRLRNIPFFQIIMILLKKGQLTNELFEQFVDNYQRELRDVVCNIETPDTLKGLPPSQVMLLMHPKHWPTLGKEDAKQNRLSEERSKIFGKDTVELLRMYSMYPSLETSSEEEKFTQMVQSEMKRRWETIQSQAISQFSKIEQTTSFLWNIALTELENLSEIKLGQLFAPIPNCVPSNKPELQIILHEYAPELECKEWSFEEFSYNDAWLKGRRIQYKEQLRKYNLLSKICMKREEVEQLRELSEETIKILLDELRTGKNWRLDNCYEDNNCRMIAMCARQWKIDRNFTFLLNSKVRLQQRLWNIVDLEKAIKQYKIECIHLIQRTEEPPISMNAPLVAAILTAHPRFWPSCCKEERESLLNDPEIRASIEDFGEIITELFRLYQAIPKWKDEEMKNRHKEELKTKAQLMVQNMLKQCEAAETEYPLWIIISKMLFYDVQTNLKGTIEGLGDAIILSPVQDPAQVHHSQPRNTQESTNEEEEDLSHREEEESDSESESSSEDTPIEERPIQEIIERILTTRNTEEAKELINICRKNYRQVMTQEGDINVESTIIDLLSTTPGDKWPVPKVGACPFAQECSETLTSTGQARMHIKRDHNFDTTRVRDEIHIILEYLTQQEIKQCIYNLDGIQIPKKHGQYESPAPILCHFCDYESERDSYIETHRTKVHKEYEREIREIGLFWAVARYLRKKHKHIPILNEFLTEKETYRCTICGIHKDRMENMMQHISKAHSTTNKDITQSVIVKYEFRREHEEPEQPNEEEEDSNEKVWTVPARYVEATEIQTDQLTELGITKEKLQQVVETGNQEAFKIMIRMIMLSKDVPISMFIKWYMELRKNITPREQTLFKDDIGSWLWKTKEIPLPELTYGCPTCDAHFETEKEWWKHRQLHQTKIIDISPAKDQVRGTIEETVMVATSTEQEFSLNNQIMRCPVPGCSFCCMSLHEYEQHRENMLTNELHIEFRDCTRRLGPFYGALTFMMRRSQRIPTISEFLGQTTGMITICSTCHKIIHGKQRAIMEHYRDMNHCQRKSELTYKMRIFERPTSETALTTHFDLLVNRDRRALDDLLRMSENIALSEIHERELTEEERARDAEATQVREQRLRVENMRIQREAAARMRARELGLNEEQEIERALGNSTVETTPDNDTRIASEETTNTTSSESEEQNETHVEVEGEKQTEEEDSEEHERDEEERQRREEIERANQIIRLREQAEDARVDEQDAENLAKRKRQNKALSWRDEGIRNEKKGYQLPKLDQTKRSQIQEGLHELWHNEIKPLIEDYLPNDPEDEKEWLCFEGAIYRMEHLLRTHVMIKCGRKPTSMFRKIFPKYMNEEMQNMQASESQIDRGFRIAKLVEKLAKAHEENKDTEIRRLEDKIRKRLSRLSLEERRKWWNTERIEDIEREIVTQINNSEAYGKWLEDTLIQATGDLEKRKAGSINETRLQENYADNPGKTMKNVIWKQERPECEIPMKDMKKAIVEASTPKEIIEEDGDFEIHRLIESDESQEAYEFITDIEKIEQAISSRKWLSAAGVDGLDYSVFKLEAKESAAVIQKILEACLRCRRAPVQFKNSRTVFIYKKGDRSNPKNWRPLSISNALYRICMVVFSNYIEHCNRLHAILHESQKGFISGVNGTAENILSIMELFHDAQRSHKSLYVTAIDFQNAFGSVSHKYMIDAMRKKGIASNIVDVIQNIYTGSNTRIQMREGNSSQIDLKCGVKQGCPLSPLIFNMALDTLIRDLENHPEYGYKIDSFSYTVQAYADDVLLISKSEEDMNKLIERVSKFTQISGMKLAPEKCTAYVYGMSRAQKRFYEAEIKMGDQTIQVAKQDETIRYLGAPITARKVDRLKELKITEAEFRMLLEKITQSRLAIVQKVDAIKKFLLPKWEYEFMVNQVKVHVLDRMDRAIRVSLDKIIGAKLPIAVFHASWKDGGLGIPRMRDRQQVAVIRSLLCLMTSKHEKIRHLINHAVEQERKKRKIDISEESPYLGWNVTEEERLTGTKGTNSLTARACRSVLGMRMKLTKEEDLEREVLKLKTQENMEAVIKSQSSANEIILQTIRERWKKELAQPTFHLHSFISLAGNKNANAFMIRASKPAKDAFIKFAIRARTNTLPTDEFKEIIEGRQHTGCRFCRSAYNRSIQHILNGCPINRRLIMDRHDSIVNLLAEALRTEEHAYVAKDARIFAVELQQNRRLKPDLQFWNAEGTKVLLIEVNSPYAKSWEAQDSLQEKYEAKQEKYRDLVRELQDKGIRVKLVVVVVSSLGAVYKESEEEVKRLIPNRKKANQLCRKLSTTALYGSAKIWWENARKGRQEDEDQEDSITEGEDQIEELAPIQEQEEVDIEENERWLLSQTEEGIPEGESRDEIREENEDEMMRRLFG